MYPKTCSSRSPDPLKFGAYSAKSTRHSHSMTLWLVHSATSLAVGGGSSGTLRLVKQFGSILCSRKTFNQKQRHDKSDQRKGIF